MTVSRRKFLGNATVAVIAGGTLARGKVFGANDRLSACCIGVRGKGASHIRDINRTGDAEVAALCDIDKKVLGERGDQLRNSSGKAAKLYGDVRDVMADESIDFISIATPNHWHALMTVWACQAGKDVYVEKPASWCISEGRRMVEAARKYNRIVQVGTQARSFPHVREAIQEMKAGLIGDLYMARGLCFKRRDSIGFKDHATPPDHVDFDLWLGPARKQPYHGNLVHYNWHWFWDFGNGDIGNQGIHELDLARWALEEDGVIRVHSTGGRFGYNDQGETPNTLSTTFTYPEGSQIVFEVRGRYTNAEEGVQIGNLYYGSEGFLPGANWGEGLELYPHQNQSIADWNPKFGYGREPYGGKKGEEKRFQPRDGKLDEDYIHHWRNFIDAVHARDHRRLNADILEGHQSAMLAHCANISYRLGMPLSFDAHNEVFVGEGAEEANPYLTREYRTPFVVPKKI